MIYSHSPSLDSNIMEIQSNRDELNGIIFGTEDSVRTMSSDIPIEDRLKILRREFHVECEMNVLHINPVHSQTTVMLVLENHTVIVQDHHVLGCVFDSVVSPVAGMEFAFCRFNDVITDARFDGDLMMMGCVFGGDVRMCHSTVHGDLSLDCSMFENDAIFNRMACDGTASFDHCTFKRKAGFNSCDFKGRASFRSVGFYGVTDFADTTFSNKALFDRVVIDGDDTETDYTVFADAVSFSAAKFDHFANFHGTSFLKSANFNGAIFNSKTFFEGADLPNKPHYVGMSFKNTHFGIYTSISDVSIEGEFRFESVTCDGELFVSGTRFLKSPILSDLIVNGYTTFQRLEFGDDVKKMSVIRSTFHGDLDVNFLVKDMDQQNLRTLLLSTCWITGHLHIAGAVNLIDLQETVVDGAVRLDIQRKDEKNSPDLWLDLRYASFGSNVQFRWVRLYDNKGHLEGNVLSEIGKKELFEAVRILMDEPGGPDNKQMAAQMLMLRNAFDRIGRFDEADFFLRKYNNYQCRTDIGPKDANDPSRFLRKAGMQIMRVFGQYGTDIMLIATWMILIPTIVGAIMTILGSPPLDAFKDSFVAFITMSLGVDPDGLSDIQHILLIAEGFLGVFLMSFLVTSIARKLFR